MTEESREGLTEIYLTLKNPGSLSGVAGVLKEARKRNIAVTRKDVEKWLQEQRVYGLHKRVRRKYKTKKVVVGGINNQVQADLVDMQNFAKSNNGYRYILTVLDCFSRFGSAVPLKDKTGKSLLIAFKKVFGNDPPLKLQVDKGTEFYNRIVKDYLKENDVEMFSTESPYKAQMVERWNRTIKEKMWKYFTWKQTDKWVNVLGDIVDGYNATIHSAINIAPKDVNETNQKEIWWHLYGDYLRKRVNSKKAKFAVGDQVRISKAKRQFEKGYLPNFTEEIFTICDVRSGTPFTYVLKDYENEKIEGIFYEPELVKVKDSGLYLIERIVRRKGTKVLVKWKGYPETMNEWISAEDMEKV